MKKSLFLFLTALLLPLCSAWAGSDYYAKLTASKASASTGSGKVYVATASTTPSDTDYKDQADAIGSTNSKSSPVNVTFYLYAQPETGSEFAGWTEGSGVTVKDKSSASTTATISSSNTTSPGVTGTVTATFNIIKVAGFQVSFAAPQNGTYTVNGSSVGSGLTSAEYTGTYTPTLVATPNSGYVLDGWYESTDGGATKTLKSRSAAYNPEYLAATTVYAVFVPVVTVTTLEALTTSLTNNACTEIPSGTTIAIPSGTTVTVGEGKQLVVNGQFNVFGTLTNSGVIGGSGKIVTVKKTITQTGNSDGTPIVTETIRASDQKKYYMTTVADASGKVSGIAPGCKEVLNGAEVRRGNSSITMATYPTSETSPVLAFAVNTTTAVNCIRDVVDPCYYANAARAMASVTNKTDRLIVLLADATLDPTTCKDAGIAWNVNNDGRIKLDGNFRIMDLAGKKLTVKPDYIHNYTHVVLNGQLGVTTLMYGGNVTAINCSSVVFSKIKEDYASVINIYDLTGTGTTASRIVSAYNGSNAIKNAVNFYSSSTASYSASQFLSKAADSYHIYGGKWTAQPDAKYIASVLASDYAFYKVDGQSYYELQPKANREVVTFGTGEKYESFDEAATALATKFASADSVTMTLVKSATLSNPITIPVGKTLELELAGCSLTAAKGFAVNHGTLILGDNKANLSSTGGRIVTTSGNFIENDGSVDITYGYYTGAIALTGGTFTTHHGRFTGAITAADKSQANLLGGCFDTDVSALLKKGYFRSSGYVGPIPPATISKTWDSSNGGYWKYSFQTLSTADLKIYNTASSEKSGYSLADWKRRAELKSMCEPWLKYMVDIAAGFDRSIKGGSASSAITAPIGITRELPDDVAAGSLYRILSPQLTSTNSSQYKYEQFITNSTFQRSGFGIYSTKEENFGTTINMRIDLCNGSDANPQSQHALMSEYTVIGAGSNQAMIQPALGAATFYATIAEAVSAAKAGDTIKLCNDITSTEAITVSKSCSIDTNGMTFNGSIVAGQGYALTSQTTTLPVEKMLGKVHTTYTIVKTAVEPEIEYSEVPVKMTEEGTITPQVAGATITIINSKSETLGSSTIDIEEQANKAEVYTIKTTIGSETTETKLGVIKVKEEETLTEGQEEVSKVTKAVAVPFKGATVANILNTALLKEGDMLNAYINKKYYSWKLTSDKTWEPISTARVGGDSDSLDPEEATLDRGTAIWVTSAEKVVVLGEYKEQENEEAEKTEVPVKDDLETGHNLLGNAKMEAATPTGVATGLQVQIIGDTKTRYNKTNAGWESLEEIEEDFGGKKLIYEEKGTKTPKVPVGGAFWLVK